MSALSTAHRAAGGLSLAAGVFAVLGGLGPQLRVRSAAVLDTIFGDSASPAPQVPAAHWAVFAGALLVAAGAGLFLPGRAERIRPAASVVWAALAPPALSALRTAAAAVDASADPDPFVKLAAPALGFDWGAWLLVAALVCAGAAGLACLVAGVFDRESWEELRALTEAKSAQKAKRRGRKARQLPQLEEDPREVPLGRLPAALYAAAGIFGALGLLLPLYVGKGFRSPWLPDVPFSSQAFGQFLLAVAVAGAAVVGARSRRSRQPALCAGAAFSLVVYVAGYPFLSASAPGAAPGPGLWASVVAAGAFVAAAGPRRRGSAKSR
ncbi:hypothetical protein Srot_1496 [Segniliparus rotundus DSM 44985]|uniref:Uncharacterized protein n=1 Tax=Segniliparus rotundus (strain ATCC BAA-972 / CDC 1076 / CIP 108378 / DSM 44985 / JCM 13578) TaxID=640132 RepID=D6Z7M9_SEGRD|nr:hypothetical protein [Segniliparus rotundus]ADG97959.1 hypothetical protein Srot_1496 [Segniliparus rotundus DSM 44985]